MNINFIGPQLHQQQLEIFNSIIKSDKMYHSIVSCRQFGKSFLAIQLLLYFAFNYKNSKIMFTSPTYAQASKVFKEMIEGLKNGKLIKKFNAAENSVILVNGTEVYFKSVQVPDNLRGYSLDFLFMDEAALYKDNIFYEILRPMLMVRGKKCILLSTPKGKNYFYDMVHNQNYCSYSCKTNTNPYANKEEIKDAKLNMPDRLYRQEYEAEFIDDGGEVFGNIKNCATITKYSEPIMGRKYYAGIDLGRASDYSVLTIIDESGNIVLIFRKNKSDWTIIVDEIVNILNRYKPINTVVECNGIGDVVFEMIKKKYKPFSSYKLEEFITTNDSKQGIIEELILSLQQNKIFIPTTNLEPLLHSELESFTFNYSTKTRRVMYSARNGLHDDMVMSLALANYCFRHGINKGRYLIV